LREHIRQLGEHWREWFTKFYLDTAEKLPSFRGGFIRDLQQIRERERGESEKLHTRTRAPSGAGLSYTGFRLLELFPAEEYDRLLGGLRRLFPAKPYGRDQIDRFSTTAPDLFQGGWSNIGTLVRENKWLGMLDKKVVPQLPTGIDYVDVSVHKVLPSAVIVAFDAHLSESATAKLKELHARRYLPRTIFHRFAPWSKHSVISRSQSPVEWAMQDAILRWERGLHEEIEKIVTPYLRGFFNRSGKGRNRLPVLDCFSVTGMPQGVENIHTRMAPLSGWLQSASIQPVPSALHSYLRNDLMFVWEEHREERVAFGYRFVQLHGDPPAPDPSKLQGFADLRDELDAVLPYVCFLEAIRRVTDEVETLRLGVYKTLAGTSWFHRRFHADIRLNDRVQREAMFVSRLSLELKDAKPWLKGELETLRGMTQKLGRENEEFALTDALDKSVTFSLSRVRKHLALIAATFSDYIARRNITLTYRLQRQVWLLTILATLAAMVSMATNWNQLRQAATTILKR
jgi:hypothetical protein